MKDLIKKISIGGYIAIAGGVLGLVAMIIALVSCSPEGFAIVQIPMIIIFSLLALILLVGAVVLSAWKGDGLLWNGLTTVMVLGAVVLLTFTLFNMIDGKQDVLGTVMFSDLEKGFAPAEFACYVGFASMIVYLVSIVVTLVGSFLRLAKKEAPAANEAAA